MRPARPARTAPEYSSIDFAESAVIYEIKFYMGNHAAINEVSDAIRTNVWYELRRQRITIPFPIRTLHLERKAKGAAPEGHEEARAILRGEPLFNCLAEDQIDRTHPAICPQSLWSRRTRSSKKARRAIPCSSFCAAPRRYRSRVTALLFEWVVFGQGIVSAKCLCLRENRALPRCKRSMTASLGNQQIGHVRAAASFAAVPGSIERAAWQRKMETEGIVP